MKFEWIDIISGKDLISTSILDGHGKGDICHCWLTTVGRIWISVSKSLNSTLVPMCQRSFTSLPCLTSPRGKASPEASPSNTAVKAYYTDRKPSQSVCQSERALHISVTGPWRRMEYIFPVIWVIIPSTFLSPCHGQHVLVLTFLRNVEQQACVPLTTFTTLQPCSATTGGAVVIPKITSHRGPQTIT